MKHQLYRGTGELLIDKWLARLQAATDPLRPKLVLAPNLLVGRELFDRASARLSGWANLEAMTFEQLALRLSLPSFEKAGLKELTPLHRRILISAILRQSSLTYLKNLVGQQGLIRTIDALFADLEEAGLDDFPTDAAKGISPDKIEDLAWLYKQFRSRIKGSHFTMFDVYQQACCRAPEIGNLLGLADLTLFGFADFTYSQQKFLKKLGDSIELLFLIPWADDQAHSYVSPLFSFVEKDLAGRIETLVDQSTARQNMLGLIQERFYREPQSDWEPATDDRSVKIISAPDEMREAKEVVRDLLAAAARGIPFSEMAITYAGDNSSRLLLFELASVGASGEGGKIPTFIDGDALAQLTQEGLQLVKLWQVAGGIWGRAEVLDLARLCPPEKIKGPDGKMQATQADQWDLAARSLSIVKGPQQWRKKLQAAIDYFNSRQDLDADEAIFFKATGQLFYFLEPLLVLREMIEGKASVADLLAQVRRVVFRCCEDLDVRKKFLEGLQQLEADKLITESLTPAEVLNVVGSIAEELRLSWERYRQGSVSLIPLHRLRHLTFKHVVVFGLLEQNIPSAGRQDPLLLDHERKRINANLAEDRLPLKGDRYREQVYLFRQALSVATESITFTYPRGERIGGKQRICSHFLTYIAEGLMGEVGEEAIVQAPGVRFISEGQLRLPAPDSWVSSVEMEVERVRLAATHKDPSICAGLLGMSGLAQRGLNRMSRRINQLLILPTGGPHSGIFSKQAQKRLSQIHDPLQGEISPTRLEDYAACPRKYLLSHVFGLRPLDEPGESLMLNPLDKGSVLHRVLREAFEDALAENLFPLNPLRIKKLTGLFDQALEKQKEYLLKQGAIGHVALWDIEREERLADLRGQLRREVEQFQGMTPLALEVRFGKGKIKGEAESALSTNDPAVMKLDDGRIVYFRGKIDRVDSSGTGRLQVIDYKTGKKFLTGKKRLLGGESLQLPVYHLAARQIFRDLSENGVDAYYFHNTYQQAFSLAGIDDQGNRDLENDFGRSVKTILDGIHQGIFFPEPKRKKPPSDHCRYCDFYAYCGPGIKKITEHKQDDPARKSFREMKEIA